MRNPPASPTPSSTTHAAEVDAASVQLLPPEAFYPFHFLQAAAYASRGDADQRRRHQRMWRRISRRAYAAHLWNRKTAPSVVERGSLLHRLLSTFTVLPPQAGDELE